MKIAYFLVRYPTLSQTFIQREIEGLIQQGIEVHVLTCQQFRFRSFESNGKLFIHSLSIRTPLNILITLINLLKKLHLIPRLIILLFKHDWKNLRWFFSENFWANLWGFILGIAYVKTFKRFNIPIAHAGWAALPATAAAVSAQIRNIPFTMGAHAYDIYRNGGDEFLKEKCSLARFIHTTTQANVEYLSQFTSSEKIILARRGLRFLPDYHENISTSPLKLLSVGRLIPKKGFLHLFDACAILKERNIDFELKIIGEGLQRKILEDQIRALNLSNNVILTGALSHQQVENAYQKTSIFLHNGIIDPEGDRDGLPNVIPEAMAFSIPVISSNGKGASEAVTHEQTGLLVDAKNPSQIVDAILRLKDDESLREHITQNAYNWVKENFTTEKNSKILAQAFLSIFPE